MRRRLWRIRPGSRAMTLAMAAGLAVGLSALPDAAQAGHRHHRNHFWAGYYAPAYVAPPPVYYAPPPVYYAPPPPPPVVYAPPPPVYYAPPPPVYYGPQSGVSFGFSTRF